MQKYKWLIPLTSFSVLLITIRVAYTSQLMFSFLLWNIFLAAIPLFLSVQALKTNNKLRLLGYSGLWLLFFPNSMYIITDLFHLTEREQIPLWYDLILLFSSAMNGLIYGFLSLSNMEKIIARLNNNAIRNLLVFCVMLLCGYGIYLGRFERWNSWDIITQPHNLAGSILSHIVHPFRNIDVWSLSFCFGLWMYLLYRYARILRVTHVA